MKRALIDMSIMTTIFVIVALVMIPFNEITFRHFIGLIGLIGYLVVRLIIDTYYAKRRLKENRTANRVDCPEL